MRTRDEQGMTELFQILGRALSRGDAAAAADCWTLPALMTAEDRAAAITDRRQLQQHFAGVIDAHRARGAARTAPEILRAHWHTDRVLSADVRWPHLTAEGHRLGAQASSYLVWFDDHGMPRIRVAFPIAGNEQGRRLPVSTPGGSAGPRRPARRRRRWSPARA